MCLDQAPTSHQAAGVYIQLGRERQRESYLTTVSNEALRLFHLGSLHLVWFSHDCVFQSSFSLLWVFHTHSLHIFIMDSRVWAKIGSESSLLLFMYFSLLLDLYLCHWAHYYYGSVLTSSLEFTFVQNVFSCDFRLASSSDKEAKREEKRGEFCGIVSHPFFVMFTCIIADVWSDVIVENMLDTWYVWDVLSSHTWHKFFPRSDSDCASLWLFMYR